MGDFTLGCLLGQYDRAQSFDVNSVNLPNNGDVGSWSFSAIGSYAFPVININNVHSSNQAMDVRVGSWGTARETIIYDYNFENDAYGRFFSDITTHNMRTDFWARIQEAVDSGAFFQDFRDVTGEQNLLIGASSILKHHRQEVTTVTSGVELPRFRIVRANNLDQDVRVVIDDVLTQIDPITIHPTYSFTDQSRIIKAQHRTIGGKSRNYLWEKGFSWEIPLRYISTSHANLINWWWENQFNLLLTLDTSDSNTMYTGRISNKLQPIGSRIRPYEDQWEGTITFNSLNEGNLVF